MGYSAAAGSFNIDTAKTVGQTQAITGLGFQPKIVFFFWGGTTAIADTVEAGIYNLGFGVAISSTSRGSICILSEDGQADSDTHIRMYNTEAISGHTDTATIDGIMDVSSLDADGFTLIVDDQFTQAYRISYLALGGTDLTNVFSGWKLIPTSTGNYSITGVGFQPDAVLMFWNNEGYLGEANTAYFSLGMATGSSNQGVVSAQILDGQATSYTRGYGYSGEVINAYLSGQRDTFVSMDADGFTLNHLEGTESSRQFIYVCLKGGQYKVHDFLTNTTSTDIVESDVGFTPVAIMFHSANRALSTQDALTNDARLSIGAGTSASNRACAAMSDENGLATTETARANYDSYVYAYVKDDALYGAFDIKSIDASGFTLDGDDGAASWVTYLAIGATAAEPGGNILPFTSFGKLGADCNPMRG